VREATVCDVLKLTDPAVIETVSFGPGTPSGVQLVRDVQFAVPPFHVLVSPVSDGKAAATVRG
jgi:hypothetical protein